MPRVKTHPVNQSRTTKKCPHGRRRCRCKECGGASVCEHGRRRAQCKECGGSSICEHGRQRGTCKECSGSAFCEHGRRRSTCKECGGSGFCEHGRWRYHCKPCGGPGQAKCTSEACAVYDLDERKRAQFNKLCWSCFSALHPDKAKTTLRMEHLVLAELQRRLPHLENEAVEVIWDCPVQGLTDCTLKRPDMLWIFVDNGRARGLHFELDEEGKKHEDKDGRLVDIQQAKDLDFVYVVRMSGKGAYRIKRRVNGDRHHQAVQPAFDERLAEASKVVGRVWELVKAGVAPDEDNEWKTYVGF